MNPVISRLIELIKPMLNQEEFGGIKSVVRTNDTKARLRITADTTPLIQVWIVGTDITPGPFGDTRTRNYQTKIRVVLPQTDSKNKNLEYLDKIEDELNKIVSSKLMVHGAIMDETYYYTQGTEESVSRLELIGENSSVFDALDYDFTFSRMEEWDGMRNTQERIVPLAL